MTATSSHSRKLAPILVFLITFLLILSLSLPWVSAEEEKKPTAKEWQINGIVAALDDGYDVIKGYALRELEKYDSKELKKAEKNKIIDQVARILKDEDVKDYLRGSAAQALANFGQPAAKYIPDIVNILKDEKVSSSVRGSAVQALGNFGQPAAKYIPDIVKILKDEKVDLDFYNLRTAVKALGNFGQPAEYIPDMLNILKDEKVPSGIRYRAAQVLGNFGQSTAEYIPDVLNFLKDETVPSKLRSSAAEALAKSGELPAKYILDILNIFKDDNVNSYVRRSTAQVLSRFGQSTAKYIPDILNFLKDESFSSFSSDDIAVPLKNFGEAGVKYIPDIVNFLKDKKVYSFYRQFAAEALPNFGQPAEKYIPDFVNILKDEKVDSELRGSVAKALANFGQPAAIYIPDILNFLKEKEGSIIDRSRIYAARGLHNFGKPAVKYIPDFVNMLKDKRVNSEVRLATAEALANFGEPAAIYIPDILNFLKDETVDFNDRRTAAQALANFGEPAAKYIPDILNILKDEEVNSEVRRSAAQALANFGQQLKLEEVVVILNNLYEPSHSEFKKWRFLTYFTGGGTEEVKTLLTWLGYPLPRTIPRQLNYHEAKKTLQVFLKVWESSNDLKRLRNDLARKIGTIAKDQNFTWKLLDISLLQKHYDNLKAAGYNDADTLRYVINNLEFWKWFFLARNIFLIHFAIWLTIILAYPKFTPVLAPLFWNPWLRKVLGFGYIGIILTCIPWLRRRLLQPFQPLLLADAGLDNFVEQAYFAESFVKVPIARDLVRERETRGDRRIRHYQRNVVERGNPNMLRLLRYAGAPLAMTSRFLKGRFIVIATIGSNPNMLRLLRYASAPVAMTSRFLKGRSLFRFPLNLSPRNSISPNKITPEFQAITQAIPTLQGQVVLEGESGLGKSMFLRHLAKNSESIFVYLPAQKCDKGVIKAISAKLREQVDDIKFLKSLIYNGALNICIDGLNEVTADTRAKVSQFAEGYFRGNIIMTTQPLEWIPPSTARKYELQPLQREQIKLFLLSRYRGLKIAGGNVEAEPPNLASQAEPGNQQLNPSYQAEPGNQFVEPLALTNREAEPPTSSSQAEPGNQMVEPLALTRYKEACSKYLSEAFNEQQSPEDLAATKRILSNPMDLSLVALMLSQGQQPNLFRLQEQQYQLMAAEYQREWKREFPLTRFSQAVYQMRLNDETTIPSGKFKAELISLEDEKYKIVISRQRRNEKGEVEKSWYFRHDKIMEFFLVQNFLGESKAVGERVNEHINDPRFRGVYLLLANLLALDDAVELRERIIEYAANNKDHTLSDKFVQLLQLRLPKKWTQDENIKSIFQQHEQKSPYLNLVTKFLEQVDATIKREQKLHITVETIESSLSIYAPFPVLITIKPPTDKDIINLVELCQQLKREEATQKAGLLIYKLPPDTTARMEIAKVRLRDNFLLIPIPITSIEKVLDEKDKCIGLLEEYIDRYLQNADFFDDRNAISDTLSFFGRTEILQRLGEELLRYQGVGLFGLRKSGKTSVLLQLGFMLREHPIIHIDLQTYNGYRYTAAIFNQIIQNLSSLEISTCESKMPLPQFAPFPVDKPAAELTNEFIQRINQFTRIIKKSRKYKLPILCFLDEVERIIPTTEDNREKAEEFNVCFGTLRVLCQQRQMSLLVADVHPDCNRINSWQQTGVSTNPVFSFFKEIFLPPFSQEETQDMLINLGKLMGLEFDKATPQQIHYQSGGHPFVSRQIARFLTNKIRDKHNLQPEKANTVLATIASNGKPSAIHNQNHHTKPPQNGNILIEWAMVEKYLEKTLTQKGQLKNYLEKSIWEDLEKRDFQVAISVLLIIAANEAFHNRITQAALLNQLNSRFTTNQCLDACNWLINVGLLYEEEIEHQDYYYIRIPLLSQWIQMQMTEEEIEKCRIL